MLHVPYKGSGPAVTDLIGGQVDYMFDSITSAAPHIQSGKLRAIARDDGQALIGVAQCADDRGGRPAGIRAVAVVRGLHARGHAAGPSSTRSMPRLLEAMKLPEVKARFATIGAEAIGSTPAQLAAHLERRDGQVGQDHPGARHPGRLNPRPPLSARRAT